MRPKSALPSPAFTLAGGAGRRDRKESHTNLSPITTFSQSGPNCVKTPGSWEKPPDQESEYGLVPNYVALGNQNLF